MNAVFLGFRPMTEGASSTTHTFLATLAQVMATILGIFVAGFSAYLVFLEERTTSFFDVIVQDKVAIAQEASKLSADGPEKLGVFVPPEYAELYRSISNTTGAALVEQSTEDLIFGDAIPNSAMAKTINQLRRVDGDDGPWRGRIYLWTMIEGATIIAGTQPGQPTDTFPASAAGPGFDEWRKDFAQVAGQLETLQVLSAPMQADLVRFLSAQGQQYQARRFKLCSVAVQNLMRHIAAIRLNLADIDKQKLLAESYSPSSRIHVGPIFGLIALSALIGVVFPLVLLIYSVETTAMVATALLLFSFGSLAFATAQFRTDLIAPLGPKNYTAVRWIKPLVEETKKSLVAVDGGSLIDVVPYRDALLGSGSTSLTAEVRRALQDFVKAADVFNDRARNFDLRAKRELLRKFRAAIPNNKDGLTLGLNPTCFLDQKAFDDFLSSVATSRGSHIDVQIVSQSWSRRILRFNINVADQGDIARFFDSLRVVRTALIETREARKFEESRADVAASAHELEAALAAIEK